MDPHGPTLCPGSRPAGKSRGAVPGAGVRREGSRSWETRSECLRFPDAAWRGMVGGGDTVAGTGRRGGAARGVGRGQRRVVSAPATQEYVWRVTAHCVVT